MALPQLTTPTHELELPSNGQVIKFRPFLVKEEKILLMAMESGDNKDIINAVKQIINNCIITEGVSAEEFAVFDIEFFFLQLRSKSVSETVIIKYKNNTCTENDGKPCGKELPVMIKLDEIQVYKDPEHTSKIELEDGIGMIMKYPLMGSITDIDTKDSDKLFELVASCIGTIYDKDTTYEASDFSSKELEDFIFSMTQAQFGKIKNFFDTMPQLRHTAKVKCKTCGYNKEIKLRGLQDFFE